jgi:hypothetical protein
VVDAEAFVDQGCSANIVEGCVELTSDLLGGLG